ncbi:hypothetical protein [Candidatus Pantoea bituminis]|nr:hypothetical protein [Pantoea bituminis]
MSYTTTETLVYPGVYQLEQGASINDEHWLRFTDAVKEAFWLLPA